MTIRESPPSSFDGATPSVNNSSTHSKANPNAASSSSTTTTNNNDHGVELELVLSKLIHRNLDSMKEYINQANAQIDPIDQAFEKFEELKTKGSSLTELRELNKAVAKLKSQIKSQPKIHSADSTIRHGRWPDINKESDEMMPQLYKEIKFEHNTADPREVLEDFYDLHRELQICLFYFFWFPPMAIISKRVMIYLWMARPYLIREIDEDYGNDIFDELIAKGFIEPIYQKCSLMPDSCRMSLFVRSLLTTEMAKRNEIFPDYISNGFCAVVMSTIWPYSCLINVSEAIIDVKPELLEKMKQVRALYLGRWQNSGTHHIEVADTKILHGLKNMNGLMFLSLRGISLITELPSFISELTSLTILDVRACPNLEVIPDGIGLLENLTHLDMSECFFVEHMPKALANLSRLKSSRVSILESPSTTKDHVLSTICPGCDG